MAMIEGNPHSQVRVTPVGRERTPVIVIDDFAVDTSDAKRYACQQAAFDMDRTSAYPGVRSPLPRRHVVAILDAVYQLLYQVYAVPHALRLKLQNAAYSLVSRQPGDLTLSQSVPHYDSSGPWYFALTHFLNDGPFGGTGLFRHTPTGFENVRENRIADYVRAGETFLVANGRPEPGYITGSNGHYELYEEIAWRPNRLVVYPGSLLHSGLVDASRDINADPATGRLTANLFIDFQ